MIDQVTVFLENREGRLAALCRILGDAGISMHALTVADTAQYGVVRIIADTPAKACEALVSEGFRATLTQVYAVEVPDHAGGLAALLEAFYEADINVEYAYCFAAEGGKAVDILRVDNHDEAERIITSAGFRVISPKELYA
jgi:hypothetical protein